MSLCPDLPRPGFSFDNCKRNAALESRGYKSKGFVKTGTTIVGVCYKDGVVLGADSRATGGNIVADKFCDKLHKMSNKIFCAGAGTASDCDKVTEMIRGQIALLELNSGRDVRVASVVRIIKQYLYRYQGHIGCALIIGGYDATGCHLHSIAPHGSSMELPYLTMGSGSLAATAVLESRWKPDLDLEATKKLVRDATAAGILNDLGSGSSVNMVVLTKKGNETFYPYDIVCAKGVRSGLYDFPSGTTKVLRTKVIPYEIEKVEVRGASEEDEPMDI
ncbi:proteasome subunit beta type-7 [Galendromus occidentalis]|uniref:Proteasome subunit beta n=1 Tax=Galendromus occidentalis TaxID=34638 RepID=A0AAJ6QT84_9ACAR|nr:proteasome subunit beta type-7 [Galendromus occidentalis]